jgi:type II restriction enzyme
MKRNFAEWLLTFTDSIANYKYYIDFETIYRNAEMHKIELNMMNSLIGSKNIEKDFEELVKKYPEVLNCIPTLLAVRQYEIIVLDEDGNKFEYNFKKMNYSIDQYKVFMKETGLFDLIQNHLVNNLYDYVLGVESGLNSNARKNRGGHLMEDAVERFIQKAGFKKNETYFKEMYLQEIEEKWKLDMSFISNKNQATKRFDFVVKTDKCIYGIETNFYASGGSKLNETARSYKMIAEEADKVVGFEFIWLTDGIGWISARNNLKETFDNMEHIYNIADMKNGIMKEILE